jgi:branched-subunit amino acid transport protein AzlD
MPFEPLRTDEKLDAPVRRERDMDTHMLIGCSGFVFTAVAAYVLSVWPFLLFSDSEKLSSLLLAALLGPLPAGLLGILACRRFGIPGATGFVGGSAIFAVFLYLRLDQLFVSAQSEQFPRPDYPASFAVLLPVTWLAISACLAIFFAKDLEEEQKPS